MNSFDKSSNYIWNNKKQIFSKYYSGKNDFSVFLIEEYINVNIYPFMLQNFIYKPKTQKVYKQKKTNQILQ